VTLPAADELFRRTGVPHGHARAQAPAQSSAQSSAQTAVQAEVLPPEPPVVELAPQPPVRTASGRVKHDEKMTIYVTADELLDVEHARLELRRSHGLGVDRGRLVRAAVAMALADFDAHGAESALVTRLNEA
jgi:hypothetical protein